jgi:hypothetical protein
LRLISSAPVPAATRHEAVKVAGILAVWNDCAPEGSAHFERWYNREHLQERLGVPGFRCGRRYEAISGGNRRFFACYEVDDVAVLNSAPYVARLDNPTCWTRQAMQSFRGMLRTVCDLRVDHGNLIGSHVVVLRADVGMVPTPAADPFLHSLANEDGVARAQLWTASARQTRPDTSEMRVRGRDQLIAGACVVDCLRLADAERVCAALAQPLPGLGITGASALGVYALVCVCLPARG